MGDIQTDSRAIQKKFVIAYLLICYLYAGYRVLRTSPRVDDPSFLALAIAYLYFLVKIVERIFAGKIAYISSIDEFWVWIIPGLMMLVATFATPYSIFVEFGFGGIAALLVCTGILSTMIPLRAVSPEFKGSKP